MDSSSKPWYKRWWGVLGVVFLTLILIFLVAAGFYFYNSIQAAKLELSQAGYIRQLAESGQVYSAADNEHYWLGSDKAKITIVEFGDFACPNCEKSFSTIREIGLKYKNDIKFIWRDYPVVADYSALLALAGRCAGEQGLFWPMHDKLFQNQGVDTADQLSALANQIGADMTRYNDCMNKQKYLAQIQKDLTDGQTFGNNGTPTWFINGYKVEGDIPYDTFIKIIEGLKK